MNAAAQGQSWAASADMHYEDQTMRLFGKTNQLSQPSVSVGAEMNRGLNASGLVDPATAHAVAPTGPKWTGPNASQIQGPDVFRTVDEDWGRRQTLLGYSDRLRCEQPDASGWEFHRGASFSPDSSRRFDEDDTTLQIVALHGPMSPARWAALRYSYADVMHEDFGQLADARFTATDVTGAPICVFRIRHLAVRVRMTGTLANRQYTRVYAIDVCQHLDASALGLWLNATAASL
jgi:hypothetical protein